MTATAPPAPARASATPEMERGSGPLKLGLIRLVHYITNYVISHTPSFTVRRWWYAHVLGVSYGPHAGIHLGCHIWCYGPGQVRRSGFRLGAHSRVNRDCCLDVRGGLTIGDNVSISPEVTILTAAHGVNDPQFRVHTRPVTIEDNVWVGTRAIILPGVTLGRGAVVAAGAIVTRDAEPLAIVAGIPARPVGRRDEAAAHYVLDTPFPWFE